MASSRNARRYIQGDVIIGDCVPIAKILSSSTMADHCANCFENKEILIGCDFCEKFKYCNDFCKRQDWDTVHEIECSSQFFQANCMLRNVDKLKEVYNRNQRISDMKKTLMLLTFRIYAQLKINPDSAMTAFVSYDGSTRSLKDLLDAEAKQLKNEYLMNLANVMTNVIKHEVDHWDVKFLDILSIICVVKKNLIKLYKGINKLWDQIGWGVCLEISVVKHSCKPTAVFVNSGPTVSLRAISEIDPGQPPSINVVNIVPEFENKLDRRRRILQVSNFICNCELCAGEDDSHEDFSSLSTLFRRMVDSKMHARDSNDWIEINTISETFLRLARRHRHEYDPCITDQLMITLDYGIFLEVNSFSMKSLYRTTCEHLQITYGKDNPCFKQFTDITDGYFYRRPQIVRRRYKRTVYKQKYKRKCDKSSTA